MKKHLLVVGIVFLFVGMVFQPAFATETIPKADNKTENVELDEYTIICSVNYDTLTDFVDIVKKEIDMWQECEAVVNIRRLICSIETGGEVK